MIKSALLCVFALLLICENCIWHILSYFLCIQVSWLRSQFPSLDIEVDGGVGPDSIHKCAEVNDAYTTG